jgi:DNA-binding CsgD family transcriptional regulator
MPTIDLRSISELRNVINDYCKDFFSQHGFNYFQYLRCYIDGSFSLLTNNMGLTEEFAKFPDSQLIFSSFDEGDSQKYSYWFLWDEELPDFPVSLARDKFGLHHGLTLVRRSRNYYDMIAVALPNAKNNINTFYLNKQKIIENFINNFDKNNLDLLRYLAKHSIQLPYVNRDVNYQKICLSNNKIKILGREKMTYITGQELACVQLLLQGATIKQIADLLKISPRTVETYFNRIKLRTGFTNKADFSSIISCT